MEKVLVIGEPTLILSQSMAKAYEEALKETTPPVVYKYEVSPLFNEKIEPVQINKSGQELRRERRAKKRKSHE